jgi:AcrR family transcriptional regulator
MVESKARRSGDSSSARNTPPRTQEQRRGDAEKALLDSATRLFALYGLEQTSLGDIGEKAGYSRGLVNHHFGTKVALIERLARRTQRIFVERLDDFSGREMEALRDVVEAYFATVRREGRAARAYFVMWGAALTEKSPLRPIFADADAQFRWGIEEVIRSGQRNKTIAADLDPSATAVALAGMLRGAGAQFLIDPRGVDLDASLVVSLRFLETIAVKRVRRTASRGRTH